MTVTGTGARPAATTTLMRRTLGALAIVVAALVALVALAGPAAAHASLDSSDPPSGAVLAQSPTQISLRFDEAVDIALGAIRLYDGTGHELDVGAAHHPSGDDTQVAVSTDSLPKGAYVVSWRVVSADSHPVNGAFTFQVGTGNAVSDPGLVGRLLSEDGGNPAAGAVLGVARFVSYAAIAVLVGGLVLLVVVWPAGRRRRRVRVLLWITLGAGVVAGAVAIAAQAPYASGRALSDALKPGEWSQVLRTRSGRAWGLRVALFAAAGALLLVTLDRLRARWWQLTGIFAGLGLLILVAAGGHGTTGRWAAVGFLATIAHVGAMAVWVGGLVVLLVGVLREPDAGGAVDRTRRFSPVAFGAVAVIVASGVVQAYRQVGSIDALRETEYGRLLLIKTGVVVALVAVAWWSRRLLPQAPVPASPVAAGAAVLDDPLAPAPAAVAARLRRRLRITVGAEVALAAVVLAVTSILVASSPAVTEVAKPFNATIMQGSRLASLTIDPASVGRNTLHIYISTPGGALDRADEITVRMTSPERNLGPIPVGVAVAGPNHVTTDNMQIPYRGTWQLEVLARFGESEQVRFATNFTVH
jgi:copper transport protein